MYSEQSGMENRDLFCSLAGIAFQAGKAIMKVYSGEFDVEFKDDKSPLTAADRASHEIITAGLGILEYNGNILPVISEEGEIPDWQIRKDWEYFWMIDPLDGTKEFVNRRDEFTVNIALIGNDRPVLGLVYLPVKETLYFGGVSAGAYRTSAVDTELLKADLLPQNIEHDKSVLRAAGSRSHRSPEFEKWIESEAVRRGCSRVEIVTAGSSLKFCLAAEGAVDIYPRFGPTMEWDTAAAHAVVEGAGKKCTGLDGSRLLYNKEIMKHKGFMVT